MDQRGLDEIQQALGLTLPAAYKALVLENPFLRYGVEDSYLFDDPRQVIRANLEARQGFWGQEWPPHFLVIADNNADLYFLNLQDPSEVYLASHDEAFEGQPVEASEPLHALENHFSTLREARGWMTEEERRVAKAAARLERREGTPVARMWLRTVEAWFSSPEEALQTYHDVCAHCQHYQPLSEAPLGLRLASLQGYLHHFRGPWVPLEREGGVLGQVLSEGDLSRVIGLLLHIGRYLHLGRTNDAVQDLARAGHEAETWARPAVAMAFYTQAQQLGANAGPALERLGADGTTADPRVLALVDKLLTVAEWPPDTPPKDLRQGP